METPIKMDDLGVPLFLETPIWQNNQLNLRLPKKSHIAMVSSSPCGTHCSGRGATKNKALGDAHAP